MKRVKTLYVSDLDGTLLRSDQRTSDFTNRVINELTARGMLFSYATARSFVSSSRVTAGMTARIPVILYNGAMTRDSVTGELIRRVFFEQEEVRELIRGMLQKDVFPIVYGRVDGEEKFSYLTDRICRATREFIETRPMDPRDRPVHTVEELLKGEIFYLTLIDEEEKLRPFWIANRDVYRCVWQRDIYSGEQWLEIMPPDATKANAAKRVAEMLGCDRIVAFGDAVNDLALFQAADEAYAVENAVPELKAAADGVIGSNDEDGVAKWLLEHYREEED